MSPHTGKVPCEDCNKTNGKNHLLIRHNKEMKKYMYLLEKCFVQWRRWAHDNKAPQWSVDRSSVLSHWEQPSPLGQRTLKGQQPC